VRIAVTGATGLVGSHSAAALIAGGHEVRLLARRPFRVPESLGPLGVAPDAYTVVEGAIEDPASVDLLLEGCEACLHAAAVVALRPSEIPEAERVNFRGARNVLGRAVELKMDPIVHVSSASALFPPPAGRLSADLPVTAPTSPYGRTKADCERYARRLQDRGHPVVITYPGGVTGPNDPGFGPMASSLAAFVKGGYQPLPSTGGVMLVDVRDLAAAHAAVFESGLGPRRFMAGGRFLDWESNADLIDAGLAEPLRRIPLPASLILGVGRLVDVAMRLRELDIPLDYETAYYMTHAYPSDDSAVHDDLGIAWRPPGDTYADLLRWLAEIGEIPEKMVVEQSS
jgi:dihydroflavonol-4-reductase